MRKNFAVFRGPQIYKDRKQKYYLLYRCGLFEGLVWGSITSQQDKYVIVRHWCII